MQQKTLNDKLHLLDFDTNSSVSGLLFVDHKYKGDINVSFDEVLVLHRAQELGASAVYFRRIGGNSIPQLFIFDNSKNRFSSDNLIDIHKKLWSSGIVSLYYIFDKTDIRIFNCRKPLEGSGKNLQITAFDSLSLTAKAHAQYERYSAKLFENGSFWETKENRDRFKADDNSNDKLINELKRIQINFSKNQNPDVCNKLLVLSILVKYLEERKDKKGNPAALKPEYFNKYDKANCFCDVLRKNKCTELFADLSKEVNGKIFELGDDEKSELKKLDQSRLADFLDARIEKNQRVFWRLYDFNYIPVELISRIYEEFIPKRKDITYTPVHLVNFMVDECMPMHSPKDNIKIIDVSCGSGIFLVVAFKRIVQWWQNEQFKKTGKIKPPTLVKLKSILTNSIYGIDIEHESVRLATFSLTLALLDMLDPTKMWDELTKEKLIGLKDNIIKKDFFDYKTDKKFNLVIGNPPFNPPVEGKNDAEDKKKKEEYWENLTKKVEMDFAIPDKNIALLFLQQSVKLLKENGLLSLVMPSGALLYNDTLHFRENFLNKYNVPQILDFSSLSPILFPKRNVAVSVIFAQNNKPDDKDILHVVIKRTITTKEKLFFEIDKYDLYYVPKEVAKTEQIIWKANYLGGGHLFNLVKRMQGIENIEDYLKQKKKNNNWAYGEGYVIGKNGTKKAPYLTNKRMIHANKFVDDIIKDCDIDEEEEKTFYRIAEKNKQIFESPHILIKKNLSLYIAFDENNLRFRHDTIGIHAPDTQKERSELVELRQNLISNRSLYQALLLSWSGQAGISRSPKIVLTDDIMVLPYPKNKEKLRLSKAEQIVCDDILKYGIDQLSRGETAKVNYENVSKRTITEFSQTFCASLNSIYEEKGKEFYPLEYIESISFICLPIAYGDPNKSKPIPKTQRTKIEEGDLRILIENPRKQINVLYTRIIKLYHKDMVFLIKPKTLRYWLKSIALRDASDVFTDLVSSGY